MALRRPTLFVSLALALRFQPSEQRPGPVGPLASLEQARSRWWNKSTAQFLVLGSKATRDVRVYRWSFFIHGYNLTTPTLEYTNNKSVRASRLVTLSYLATTGPQRGPQGWPGLKLEPGPADKPPVPGAGALLCHSLFLSHCVKGAGIYSRLRGMKINRIAGVREVLSTKDGLCRTLQQSSLPPAVLWRFSFPCWVLPTHRAKLLSHLDQGSRPSTLYILKPSQGSQGQGIHVLSPEALKKRISSVGATGLTGALRQVVQPYLQEPLLHRGRKWDVRTYVLATSVLPMRLYLFSEAIVRYAVAAQYSPHSTNVRSTLTNTFVGKKILHKGVGSITASLADLCADEGVFANSSATVGQGATCATKLTDAMRDAIGRLFVAVEPQMQGHYRKVYPNISAKGFRCAECYHLLGVDLIASADGRFHVIEVNIEPDLSLSTDGSRRYDHTKRAAAYNLVHLVYSRQTAASQLQGILERHAQAIAQLDLLLAAHSVDTDPKASTVQSPPVLQTDVAEYLLDAVRERNAAGCYIPVYPSKRHHDVFRQQLELMASGLSQPTSSTTPAAARAAAARARAFRRRLQMHQLLGIVLADLDGESDGDVEARADGSGQGFHRRCEEMLQQVPQTRSGAWARRTHIFKDVWNLPS